MTAHKAWVGALIALLAYLLWQFAGVDLWGLLGYAAPPEPEQVKSWLQIVGEAGVTTLVSWVGVWLTANRPKGGGTLKAAPLATVAALGLALMLALSACADRSPAREVYNAHVLYSAALAGAVSYESLPRCEPEAPPEAVCSRPDVVEKLRQGDRVAKPLLDQAQELVRGGLEGTMVERAVQLAVSAVTTFYEIVQTEVMR